MPFEQFITQHAGRGRGAGPVVRLGATGKWIGMNRAALALLGNPARITLWFDRGRQLIGFKPAPAIGGGGLKAVPAASQQGLSLSAGSFIAKYAITSRAVSFVPRLEGDLLVIGPVEADSVPSVAKVRDIIAAAGMRGR